MAQGLEPLPGRLGKSAFQGELTRQTLVGMEGVRSRVATESRSFDGLLGIHAEDQCIEHQLEVGLGLMISSRTTEGHYRSSVFEHQVIDQSGAGALARDQHVGMPFLQLEHLDSGAKSEPQLREEN